MAPIWYFFFGIRQVADLPDIGPVLHQRYRPNSDRLANQTIFPERRNFLYAYLDQAPVGLALMRAVECDHLSRLPFQRPILDAGCGDGTFARVLFNGQIVDAGVDADEREVRRAQRTRCYGELQVGRLESLPFESERFATVFSNCVLEHIPDVESALREIHRVLRPGGWLMLSEIAKGAGGDAEYPTPWADSARTSFLSTPEETRRGLLEAGIDVVRVHSTREAALAFGARSRAMVDRGEKPPHRAVGLIHGEIGPRAIANTARALADARIVPIEVLGRKRR